MMFHVLRVVSYTLWEEQGSPMSEQANEATKRSRPYAFFVAALAIVVAFLAFLFSILIFGDLFNNATTVIAALGSLFTLIGTIVGAYFGIKVTNDTSERTHGAVEKAHGSAMEANEKTQKANDTAKKALAELNPDVARRIVER
jgi:uncharacterized protein YjbJ (UPF0337 family)